MWAGWPAANEPMGPGKRARWEAGAAGGKKKYREETKKVPGTQKANISKG